MQRTKINGVRVAKIKNRYIFKKFPKGTSPNGYHHYLIYTDKFTGENVAVQTSHLYNRDPKRFQELRQRKGMKLSLPGFEAPSIVYKRFHITDAKDKPLDFANGNVHVRAKLSPAKSKRVWSFVNKSRQKRKPTGR